MKRAQKTADKLKKTDTRLTAAAAARAAAPRDSSARSAARAAAPRDSSTRAAAVWLATDTLSLWADNPRLNAGEPVRKVADSIKRFGFGAPIVARKANREIIAGHTRWLAAKQLGLSEVPVRLLDISERDAHVLALADNKLGEAAEWAPTLSELLSKLDTADTLVAGWTQADLDRLSAELLAVTRIGDEDAPRLDRPGSESVEVTACPNCGYDLRLRRSARVVTDKQ